MVNRATRIQELSGIYFNVLQQLNSTSLPEWFQLDLTFQQMKVLYILKQNGPLKMRELSQKVGVTMPTITGIVNRMINRRNGVPLLLRVISPEDRREVWAHLTDAGLEATEMLNHLNTRLLENALVQLSEADLESIHGPFSRLCEAVTEQIHTAKPISPFEPTLDQTLLVTVEDSPSEVEAVASHITN